MTIYFDVLDGNARISQDLFVLRETTGRKNVYHFCGVSLVENEYEPNSINFTRYYALDPESGIRVEKNRVSLVQNGKETVTVPGWFGEHLQPPVVWALTESLSGQDSSPVTSSPWDCWANIRGRLENRSPFNVAAAQIFEKITKWESCSMHTLQFAQSVLTKKFPRLARGLNRIYVAGQQWLIYNCDSNTAIMGNKEDVWEAVDLEHQETTYFTIAAPLHNGWAIRLDRNGFFLVKDKHRIRKQPVAIPVGFWHRHGPWIFWPLKGDIFLPSRCLISGIDLSQHEMVAATQNLAFLHFYTIYCPPSPQSEKEILMLNKDFITIIDRQGKRESIDVRLRYGQSPHFCWGNESMFVAWTSPHGCFLAVEDASGTLPLSERWRAQLLAGTEQDIGSMGVIAGSPDIAVILFTSRKQSTQHVCLISANNKALLFSPITRSCWMPGDKILVEQADNKVYINRVYAPTKLKEKIMVLERAGDDRFRVFLDPNIVLEAEMEKVSPQSLLSYLESGLAAESDS